MKIIIITLLFFYSYNSVSQTVSKIDQRFKEGELGIRKYLAENIKYPPYSLEKNSIGLSISRISITPEGEIENIQIINSIDNAIDKEIIRVLKASKKLWIKCDTSSHNQSFYIQIAFDIIQKLVFIPKRIETSYNFFKIKNDLFIPFIVCNAFKSGKFPLVMSDDSLAVTTDRLIKEGKYKDALEITNQLIKRNPFNKEMYQARIFLYRKTNQNELITSDINKINNFAEGLSIDQFLSK
jgi:hypothetical protein